MGYDIKVGFRFATIGGKPSFRVAQVFHENNEIATITYAPSATISKISLGWFRRKEDEVLPGFVLDLETGRWARGSKLVERDDESAPDEDEMTSRKERVIPYVDDTKNCLIFKLLKLDKSAMATFRQPSRMPSKLYQLEDSELLLNRFLIKMTGVSFFSMKLPREAQEFFVTLSMIRTP